MDILNGSNKRNMSLPDMSTKISSESRENNSGGHGVQVGFSNGLIEFANCDVQVKNNGASCFYSS